MNEIKEGKKTVLNIGILVLGLLAIFLAVITIKNLKEYKYIGTGYEAGNVITVRGEGKIERTPDTARVNFSINHEARVLADAQKNVDEKFAKIKSELEELGIEAKDISTTRYSSYPRYTYENGRAPVLRGYEVSHAVLVKIKDLEKVSNVINILGKNTVTDLNGPDFGFDDDKAVSREARELAIEDAKDQAEKLAKDLGVKLVRIVSFSEDGAYLVSRNESIQYGVSKEMMSAMDSSIAPAVSVGDREITSNVTLVYEIK